MTVHDLKCWPEYFQAIWDGRKTADLRLNDRGYQVGDLLRQHEYEPTSDAFSGRVVQARVAHVVAGPPWLAPGYVMLSLSSVRRVEADVNKLVVVAP